MCIPLQDGRNLARGTAVYKAWGDLRRESQENSSEQKEEARDPSPDVEAGWISEVVWEVTYIAPTTKLFFPVNYIDVQRETKTSIDGLHEATIDDYWNTNGNKSLSEPWIGVTRFELLHTNPPEGHVWGQGRLTKTVVCTRPSTHLPEEW